MLPFIRRPAHPLALYPQHVPDAKADRQVSPLIWMALGLLPLVALVVAQWHLPPLAAAGDYAQYLLHAQALADGRPYEDTGYIYSPYTWGIGPSAQPPVWPVLLAPVVKFFGPLGAAPRVLSTVAMATFLLLAARYLLAREGRPVALLATLMVGLAMENAYALTAPLSDVPFAAFFWLVVTYGDAEGEWTWSRLLVLGGLAALATGTRVIGVALLPAIVLAGLMRTPAERRRILTFCGVAAVATVLAILILGRRVPFVGILLDDSLPTLAESVKRVAIYRFAFFEASLYPAPNDSINDAYHVLSILCILLGVLLLARRYARSLLGMSVACYGLLLVVAPIADVRYSWPLWPVAIAGYYHGICQALQWVRVPQRTSRVWALVVLMAISVSAAWRYGTRTPPPSFVNHEKSRDLFAWFQAQPDRDSLRVVFGSPRVFALYTGIPAMGPFKGKTLAETERELDRLRINRVVMGLGPLGQGNVFMERMVRQFAKPWTVIYDNDAYQVLARPAGDAPAP